MVMKQSPGRCACRGILLTSAIRLPGIVFSRHDANGICIVIASSEATKQSPGPCVQPGELFRSARNDTTRRHSIGFSVNPDVLYLLGPRFISTECVASAPSHSLAT
jgi:hypothetical protein